MKKAVLIIFLLAISLSFISAASAEIKFDSDKKEYYQFELLKAEILGTFPDSLKIDNIAIYKDNQVHATPVESNIKKSGSKYIYYAVLPGVEGNYSLKLQNARYYAGLETSENPVIVNFTVVSTEKPYFSADKGFISASSGFSLIVTSFNAEQETTVKFKATGDEVTKKIGYNDKATFTFSISELKEYTESTLEISKGSGISTIGPNSISIPVFVYPPLKNEEPFINNDTIAPLDREQNKTSIEEKTIPLEKATEEQKQTCSDLNSIICKENEICAGQPILARDIVCCSGQCEEKSSSWKWIWGLIIFIVLCTAGYWLYKKSKKSSKIKTKEEEFLIKSKKFNERMYPNLKPEVEVRKRLTRE